ncbi:MAG: cation:proton antiporter [Fimbriimonadaceae bacterium]|nr:cation:proton antiporter [Fimbriimonadaceae bacterium]
MKEWTLVLELVIALGAALALGILCERFRISSIVGYLLAGVIVGPGLGLIAGSGEVSLIAEIGVALLLFTIGLEFSIRQLRLLGSRVLFAALLAISAVLLVGTAVALAFRVSTAGAVSIGAVLSLGSTAVVLRVLRDKAELDNIHGRRALGVLLVQDVMLVPLVLLVTFIGQNSGSIAKEVGVAFLNTGLLALGLTIFVSLVVPRLLDEEAVARNRELPILLAFITCIGATWAAHELNLSPALGAFVAGMLLAENKFADQMRADVMPLRTLFVTVFFVSIGLLADLDWIGANLLWVLVGTLAVILMKVIVTHLALRTFLPGIVDSLATAIALAQVGEFSFVLAQIAFNQGVLSQNLFQGIVAISILTLLVTPVMTRNAVKMARSIAKRLVPLRHLARREKETLTASNLHGHVLVIGYGEAGQAVAHAVMSRGQRPVVLDIDPRLVRLAEHSGYPAFLGDARSGEIISHVAASQAHGVIITVPDFNVARIIIRQVRLDCPHVMVLARARYHVHRDELDVAGADFVADEESLVGEQLASTLCTRLPKPEIKKPAVEFEGRN